MIGKLRSYLTPPLFADEEQNRVAHILHLVLLTVLIGANLTAAVVWLIRPSRVFFGLTTLEIIAALLAIWFMRRGYLNLASLLILLVSAGFLTILPHLGDGVHDTALMAYPAFIVAASLLLNRRLFISFALLLMLCVGLIAYNEVITEIIVTKFDKLASSGDAIILIIILAITAITVRILTDNLINSLSRARQSERALAETNSQLGRQAEMLRTSETQIKAYAERLEQMVAERTRELEAAQERLIRQEKLAVLGQLAGGVGHELRNPLGVINNAVYILQMVLTEADETIKEYLDLIARRVAEVEKIISDLLNLSRNRTTARTEATARQLVNEVLARHPAPEGITVNLNLPADLPPLYLDPQQIRQVLANLIINAYQAMPDGGQLAIFAQLDQNQVQLSVADSGVGIATGVIEKIFEPLFTTKAKGIGLGLAVSKNLVEVNGGALKVKSVEGQGSVFTLTLPIGRE